MQNIHKVSAYRSVYTIVSVGADIIRPVQALSIMPKAKSTVGTSKLEAPSDEGAVAERLRERKAEDLYELS